MKFKKTKKDCIYCFETNEQSICCSKGNFCNYEDILNIKILATNEQIAQKQYNYMMKSVKDLGVSAKVVLLTDFQETLEYGSMKHPAILIEDEIVSIGRLTKPFILKKLIKKAAYSY